MTAAYTPALYVDVADRLANGLPPRPRPTIGVRSDGCGLVYAAAVSVFLGDPASGKTWAALAVAADQLFLGGSVLFLDLDHNGFDAIASRLLSMGVSKDVLIDPDRFRYADPEDVETMRKIVAEAKLWQPDVVISDSTGELLSLYGAHPNDDADYTRVNRETLAAMARAGSAVIAIDHQAKNSDSRAYGASGTVAKKRAVDGVMLRFNVMEQFAPGRGGKAALRIVKDRHGGLLEQSDTDDREPLAAVFQLMPGEALNWHFHAPATSGGLLPPNVAADVLTLQERSGNNLTIRAIRTTYGWGTTRASAALKALNSSVPRSPGTPGNTGTGSVPRSQPPKGGTEERPTQNRDVA